MAFYHVIRGGKTTGEVVDLLPSEALDYATSLGVGYALQEQSPTRNIIQSRLGSGEPLMVDATGTFSEAGPGDAVELLGRFNVSLWGTFGTVTIERSFDEGENWLPITYIDGTPLSWTEAVSTDMSELEGGVQYRLRCTSYAGALSWRLSQ